jgi:hypothetical protein
MKEIKEKIMKVKVIIINMRKKKKRFFSKTGKFEKKNIFLENVKKIM